LTKKLNKWKISTFVLILILIIVIVFSGFNPLSLTTGNAVAQNAVSFINTNMLQGQTATVEDVSSISGVYKASINIQGQPAEVYVTKDGKLMFLQAVPLVPVDTPTGTNTDTNTNTNIDVPKSDKPSVELFVMSLCPFGNKAEDTMLSVYNLLKDKVEWKINYIVSTEGDTIRSLHGQPETDQNIQEVCVKKEYGLNSFWDFITYINKNCGSNGNCWEDGAIELGLDVTTIQECFDNEGISLMQVEAQISGEAGATGSPTLLINGVKSSEVYKYSNSEAYKQAICSAFNEAPEECSETLESSTTTSNGGSC